MHKHTTVYSPFAHILGGSERWRPSAQRPATCTLYLHLSLYPNLWLNMCKREMNIIVCFYPSLCVDEYLLHTHPLGSAYRNSNKLSFRLKFDAAIRKIMCIFLFLWYTDLPKPIAIDTEWICFIVFLRDAWITLCIDLNHQTNVPSGKDNGQQFRSVSHVFVLFGVRTDRQPSMEIRERWMGKWLSVFKIYLT